jgi:hypothetical protein
VAEALRAKSLAEAKAEERLAGSQEEAQLRLDTEILRSKRLDGGARRAQDQAVRAVCACVRACVCVCVCV